LYFFEPHGTGGRIVYDRTDSAFLANAHTFDWTGIAANTRWFHLSGINLALGAAAASAAITAVKAMNDAAVPISFDVNHRDSLWKGKSTEELSAVRAVAATADVLFASTFDIARLLGLEPSKETLDHRSAVEEAFRQFERLQLVATTRRVISQDNQQLSARLDSRDHRFETDPASLGHVIDRIGSGDAFAGGVIDGLFGQTELGECAKRGLAAAVMKHGMTGDCWVGSREDLRAFDPHSMRDIRR
jgi:2-dehydro-3-deoxygluconokinase